MKLNINKQNFFYWDNNLLHKTELNFVLQTENDRYFIIHQTRDIIKTFQQMISISRNDISLDIKWLCFLSIYIYIYIYIWKNQERPVIGIFCVIQENIQQKTSKVDKVRWKKVFAYGRAF